MLTRPSDGTRRTTRRAGGPGLSLHHAERRQSADCPAATSAAAARAAAVQALVAGAVADHDRAAFGAARGVLLDLEGDVRPAQRERDRGAVAVRGLGRCRMPVR